MRGREWTRQFGNVTVMPQKMANPAKPIGYKEAVLFDDDMVDFGKLEQAIDIVPRMCAATVNALRSYRFKEHQLARPQLLETVAGMENADSYAWAAARLWKATLSPAERAMFKVPI